MDQLIVALIVLLVLGVWYWRQQQQTDRVKWERTENRPALLRNARLVMSEKPIRCRKPVPLHGRVDQVYALETGELCIVDTKTRRIPRVYPSDRIQGSVYATILRANGHRVHKTAYVRQAWEGRVRYLPYSLLTDGQVVALYHRREALLKSPETAQLAIHPALCRGCGHREQGRCPGHLN